MKRLFPDFFYSSSNILTNASKTVWNGLIAPVTLSHWWLDFENMLKKHEKVLFWWFSQLWHRPPSGVGKTPPKSLSVRSNHFQNHFQWRFSHLRIKIKITFSGVLVTFESESKSLSVAFQSPSNQNQNQKQNAQNHFPDHFEDQNHF